LLTTRRQLFAIGAADTCDAGCLLTQGSGETPVSMSSSEKRVPARRGCHGSQQRLSLSQSLDITMLHLYVEMHFPEIM